MSVHRQDRLKLKAKSRNVHATVTKSDSKQRVGVVHCSEKHDESQSASSTKKIKLMKMRSEWKADDNTDENITVMSDIDDVMIISDDEEKSETETRKLQLKVETICSESEDVSLIDNFRKQLLQIQPIVSTDKLLGDLPAFTNSQINNTREITTDTIVDAVDGELSPLPQMCSWCRRRKPISSDEYSASNFHDFEFDAGSTVHFNKETKSHMKNSQLISDKNNFLEEEQAEYFTNEKKTLSKSRHLNFGSAVKPSGSKFVVDEHSSAVYETVQREGTAVDRNTAVPVEERGDNLFLRLSNCSKDYSAVKSGSANSHIASKRGENSSRMSTRSVTDQSWKAVTSDKEVKLQSCPLCQLDFEKGISQLDIDGHIAACLASAEDDIIW